MVILIMLVLMLILVLKMVFNIIIVRIVFIGLISIFFFFSRVVIDFCIWICLIRGFIIVGLVIIIKELYKKVKYYGNFVN